MTLRKRSALGGILVGLGNLAIVFGWFDGTKSLVAVGTVVGLAGGILIGFAWRDVLRQINSTQSSVEAQLQAILERKSRKPS